MAETVKKTTTFDSQKALKKEIYDWAASLPSNNLVNRQLQGSCQDLLHYDKTTPLNKKGFKCKKPVKMLCYGCKKPCNRTHPVYVYSCFLCGDLFQTYRHLSRDLTGQISLVIGGRTKLGHQVVRKLLEAGSTVFSTTRYPEQAYEMFSKYPGYEKEYKDRLFFYPSAFDLDVPEVRVELEKVKCYIRERLENPKLDILVNCAAQTIRVREKDKVKLKESEETNRYGDAKYVDSKFVNSWAMRISDLDQKEMEEVYRVNAIGPLMAVQAMTELLKKSEVSPYVINVHAREGMFDVKKSDKHIHFNMAKAGLAMFTKCVQEDKSMVTEGGKKFLFHGVCPGWISVDEYYEDTRPWIVPPLDEIDGAARILFPVMKPLTGSYPRTRRHFHHLSY
jgi:NAD(P)-dependent dehydrogenase (short-subunit alcohol dehydrogenase family)